MVWAIDKDPSSAFLLTFEIAVGFGGGGGGHLLATSISHKSPPTIFPLMGDVNTGGKTL